jgi:preprotein translocase SecE subunit
MNKIKNFLIGVYVEGKRVRWPRGQELQGMIVTVLAYALFFGLVLIAYDFIVIQLLRLISFS